MAQRALYVFVVLSTTAALISAVHFTEEPADTMIDQGARVRLYCVVDGLLPSQEVVWRKNNKSISIGLDFVGDKYTIDLQRYRIIGGPNRGFFDLRISEVNRMDGGEYKCMVYNKTGNLLNTVIAQSRVARVTVYYTPVKKYPYCPFGEASRELRVGENIPACVSEHGRPPVTLELQGPYVAVPETHIDYSSVTGFAVLTMNVSEADEGRTYTCRARSPDFPFYTSTCQVGPLRVVYPPRVAIRPLKAVMSAGDEGVFVCEIIAHPQPTRIEWSFIPPLDPSRYRLYDDNRTMEIMRLRSADDARLLVCSVGNRKGNSSSERVLALTTSHRPRDPGAAPTHGDNDSRSHPHYFFTRCRQANAVIVACLVAVVILVLALVFVVCCRANACCKDNTCRGISYKKQRGRVEPIDANYTLSNDNTHLFINGT